MATLRLCSIPDCGKPNRAGGYCSAHYKRAWRSGSPLGGKTSRGALQKFVREVAVTYSGSNCLTWPFRLNAKGYGNIKHNGRIQPASRVICELVHGLPPTPKHEAAHSCGKGHEGCVNPRHLSWKTTIENNADKLGHGTLHFGERSVRATITEVTAKEILRLKGTMTQRDIAALLGTTFGIVHAIHVGRSWKHLAN